METANKHQKINKHHNEIKDRLTLEWNECPRVPNLAQQPTKNHLELWQ
jgi:hypothetical protein